MEDKILEESILQDILDRITKLPAYVLNIGVLSSNSKPRKEKKKNKKEESEEAEETKEKNGVTNAELMFIHENGSPLNNIPKRPVLDMTIKYTDENLLEKIIDKSIYAYAENFDEKDYATSLKKDVIRIERVARKIIYSNMGILEPNAPSTVRRKGENHPLFDTGQLARSITCVVSKTHNK